MHVPLGRDQRRRRFLGGRPERDRRHFAQPLFGPGQRRRRRRGGRRGRRDRLVVVVQVPQARTGVETLILLRADPATLGRGWFRSGRVALGVRQRVRGRRFSGHAGEECFAAADRARLPPSVVGVIYNNAKESSIQDGS